MTVELVRADKTGEILTLTITEAKILDETVIRQISTGLLEQIEKTSQPNVIIDFKQVRFMSSSALGMLVKINKKCKEYKTELRFCNIQPDIMEVFRITRLDKVLPIQPDLPAAMESLKKKGLFFK